jgi:hypothetical protein
VDSVAGGSPVVIPVRVHRRPVCIDPPIGIQGQREKGRGPVPPSEHPPHGPLLDRTAGQVRRILPAPGGPLDRLGWRVQRRQPAPYPEGAEFGVEFGHGLGDLLTGILVADLTALGVHGDQVSPGRQQFLLLFGGLRPVGDRLVVEVPALSALHHPQPPCLVRTGPALILPGGPAGDGHDVHPTGGGVDAAHRQGSDTHPVLLGDGLATSVLSGSAAFCARVIRVTSTVAASLVVISLVVIRPSPPRAWPALAGPSATWWCWRLVRDRRRCRAR